MDTGVKEDNRLHIVNTSQQQNIRANRPSELDESKSDLHNNSHYYRFKRHSIGYQSQGASHKASGMLNIEGMNSISGGREQSQTVSGTGAFTNNRARGPPPTLLNQVIFTGPSSPMHQGYSDDNGQQNPGMITNLLNAPRGSLHGHQTMQGVSSNSFL